MALDTELLFENEETQKQAEEIMARLLGSWSIPRSKDAQTRQDYDFIASHSEYFDTVLRLCGHGGLQLITTASREVAHIRGREGQLSRHFNKDESIAILRLLQEYLRQRNKVSLSSGDPEMFAADLLENINVTRRLPMDKKELLKVLTTLESYHLVRIDLRKKAEFGEETTVTILPSISCLLPSMTIESIDECLQRYEQETTKRRWMEKDAQELDEPMDSEEE